MLQSIWLQIPRVRCDSESEEIGSQDTVEELIQPCSAQLVGNDVSPPWYFCTTYCILMYIDVYCICLKKNRGWVKRLSSVLHDASRRIPLPCIVSKDMISQQLRRNEAFMPLLNGRQQVVASPLFSTYRLIRFVSSFELPGHLVGTVRGEWADRVLVWD